MSEIYSKVQHTLKSKLNINLQYSHTLVANGQAPEVFHQDEQELHYPSF